MNKVRGYIFSRPFMGERVPQHVQNLVIRDFCERKKLQYLLSATEYAMANCSLVLQQVLSELDNVSGLVAYSIFQLPEHNMERNNVYKEILKKRKKIHFAVEDMTINNNEEFEKIEAMWRIRICTSSCQVSSNEILLNKNG